MDSGAWWAAVLGVARSQTQLSDFALTFHFHAVEKEMATHSSVLVWRIPGTGGSWWAAVYGVAQSQTRLKQLSSSRKCKAEVVQNYELTETVSTSLCNIRVQSTLLLTNNRITAGTTQHSRFVSKVLRLLSIGNLPNALLLPPNTFQTFS